MSIRILKAGVLDTIQDQGRFGFGKWGINTNGAMDAYAADVANSLAGNDPRQAVLEMHFPASEILFTEQATISITGADFSPAINGIPIGSWKSVIVPAQSVLSFRRRNKGMRSYLGVAGGFEISTWLESRSTNMKSGVGGHQGRRLQKDDQIKIADTNAGFTRTSPFVFPWSVNFENVYGHQSMALLPGSELAWLDDGSKRALTSSRFAIHPSSDRMATHLVHEAFTLEKKQELFSSAVTFGTLQLLPSGKVLILMADHQTTGGYPRIGHVASVHLPTLSQIVPGEQFMFHWATSDEAEKMLFSLRTDMNKIRHSIREKLSAYYAES